MCRIDTVDQKVYCCDLAVNLLKWDLIHPKFDYRIHSRNHRPDRRHRSENIFLD